MCVRWLYRIVHTIVCDVDDAPNAHDDARVRVEPDV